MLGEALEALFGVRLTIGPAVEEGFYYDCYYGSKTLSDTDKPHIEKKINEVRLGRDMHRHKSLQNGSDCNRWSKVDTDQLISTSA